ncbi:MAG: hypothetical protein ACFB0D_19630 [Phormidesmis sp.]
MLIRRFILLWQQSWSIRQTRYLMLWLLTAYGAYLFWLGIRPIVFLSGALVCSVTFLVWLLRPHSTSTEGNTEKNNSNLLDLDSFRCHLADSRALPRGVHLNDTALGYWRKTYAQVEAIHQVAIAIAHKESLFIPDLLDTLHTVLALSAQFSQAFTAAKQMQTPSYQKVAHRQLQSTTYRLSQTYRHLQELHDQLLAEDMDTGSSSASGVSDRLRAVISSNKSELVK